MHKFMTILAVAAPLAIGSAPAAAGDWYVKGSLGHAETELESGGFNVISGGFSNTGDDHGDGKLLGFLGAAVGRNYGNYRFEAELTSRFSQDFVTNSFRPPTPTFFYETKVKSTNLMLNALWDFPNSSKWTPFVGAGIGAAYIDIETEDVIVTGDESETNFAYQVGFGTSYDLGNDSAVELGYRYVDLGDVSVDLVNPIGGPAGDYKADLDSHDIYIAWRMDL
jgi:opacity protein-like surface antigen